MELSAKLYPLFVPLARRESSRQGEVALGWQGVEPKMLKLAGKPVAG